MIRDGHPDARRRAAVVWIAGVLATLLLAGLWLSPGATAGYLPHSFRGQITVNGANQPAGTTWVHAEIDGVLYGQDSTASPTSGGGYSGSEYALDVTGDQFEVTDPKQGGVNGDNIIFWVLTGGGANRYVASQRGVFQEGGGPTTLDLAVTTGTNPVSCPL